MTKESFGAHLEQLEAIDPKAWNPGDLHKELSRALSMVDDARAEFSTQRSRLHAETEDNGEVALPEAAPASETQQTFMHWLTIGFAFTLPLIGFGLIALIIFMWLAAKA
jgi:hypothetical protein